MINPRRFLPNLARYYRAFSLIIVNSLLFFILLNVVAGAYLDLKAAKLKGPRGNQVPLSHREYHPSLDAVYPGMDKGQISELIKETRHLSQGYDSLTKYKERPANGKYVNVASAGFRISKDQSPWPPDPKVFNIFVFGGSTTFGYRVSDDSTIASHLQDVIRKQTDVSAAVYNFGRGGYILTQERTFFANILLQGNVPNRAIFIDGLNEFALPDGEPLHTAKLKKLMDEGEISLKDRLLRELPVTKALLSVMPKTADGRKIQNGVEHFDRENRDNIVKTIVQRYRTNLKMTTAIARTFNVVPVFVWQPVPVHEYDQEVNIFLEYDYDGNVPLLKPGYAFMASENQSGSPGDNFIWCADIQRDLKQPLYADAVHYSSEMCHMIAHRIFTDLQRKGLLGPRE